MRIAITSQVVTLNLKAIKILQADEAAESFPTLLNLLIAVERIERIPMLVGESNAAVLDFEALNLGQAPVRFELSAPARPDKDLSGRALIKTCPSELPLASIASIGLTTTSTMAL